MNEKTPHTQTHSLAVGGVDERTAVKKGTRDPIVDPIVDALNHNPFVAAVRQGGLDPKNETRE